jgi:chromosome partitioning protein
LSDVYRKLGITYADGDGAPRQGASKHVYGQDVRKVLESRGYEYRDSAQIIAFMMCKGGVGKTTSTFYLSQRLSAYGARVLTVDADAQGNLTSGYGLGQYGFEIDAETPILVDILTRETTARDAIVEVTPTMHLLPSTPMNANLEGRIRELFKNPSLPIKRVLDPLRKSYDYILIDCAPALNLTNTAVVSASDLVILPVAPDLYSQLGLDQTMNEIGQIESDFDIALQKKIVFTKFDGREFTSLKYLSEIVAEYDEGSRFSTAIRTSSDVKNAVTRGEDLFALQKYRKSTAKEDYDSLAKEIMDLDAKLHRRASRALKAAG